MRHNTTSHTTLAAAAAAAAVHIRVYRVKCAAFAIAPSGRIPFERGRAAEKNARTGRRDEPRENTREARLDTACINPSPLAVV